MTSSTEKVLLVPPVSMNSKAWRIAEVFHDTEERAWIVDNADGQLQCWYCWSPGLSGSDASPCDHVHEAIRINADGKAGTVDTKFALAPFLTVPIFSGVTVGVGRDSVLKSGAWSCHLMILNKPSLNVGLVAPGEGRYAIRQLILNLLMEESADPRSCSSQYHMDPFNFNPRKGFATKPRLLDALCRIRTDECLACSDAALVPEV